MRAHPLSRYGEQLPPIAVVFYNKKGKRREKNLKINKGTSLDIFWNRLKGALTWLPSTQQKVK